ncbi:MAG TPA: glycosyltransferase family 9 protein, partial [Abditibacteriaceae bacterium]|nr:glycosyltransferase family 9 protein [Abditibacteriaceae bacterium]
EGARLDALLSQRIACDFFDSPDAPLALVQALGCRARQTHARDLLTIGIEAERQAAKILQEQGVPADFIVAMCDAAPFSEVGRKADDSAADEDETDDEDEVKIPHGSAIEYSIGGLSSVIGQSGRAAERALQAGVQAVRGGALRGGASHGVGRNATQQTVARKIARRAASRAAILRAQNGTNDTQRDETADLTASIEEPAPLDGRTLSSRRAISQWPAAHWAGALRELSAHSPVVLVGAAPAAGVTGLVENDIESRVIDLGGQLEPVVIAAILRRARLFVGTDSGVLHLAAAVGTPVVGIYGPTDWRRSGPRGVTCRVVRFAVECSPCELSRCLWQGEDKRKCLTQLPPSLVVQAARKLIGL